MSSLDGQQTNERELFEQAQTKLEEAFALLRTLEGQLRSNEERRIAVANEPVASLDEQRREEERAQLLAYVENVHNEALQLAARTRPLSGGQRELVRRITERFEKVVAQIDVRENGDGPWVAHDEPAMPEKVPDVERGAFDITAVRAVGINPREAAKRSDLKTDRARAKTEIAPPARPFQPLPWHITDDDTGAAFEPRESVVPTLITDNPLLEREKLGARKRRDRSPTEVVVRPPRHTRLWARPIVRHLAIVVAIAILVGALIGISARVVRRSGAHPWIPTSTSVAKDTPPPAPIGPPSELANPAPPPRRAVQASPPRRTPPRCTTGKCRAGRGPTFGPLARR